MGSVKKLCDSVLSGDATVSFGDAEEADRVCELAARCAEAIRVKLGWVNFVGSVGKTMEEIMPIILAEIGRPK